MFDIIIRGSPSIFLEDHHCLGETLDRIQERWGLESTAGEMLRRWAEAEFEDFKHWLLNSTAALSRLDRDDAWEHRGRRTTSLRSRLKAIQRTVRSYFASHRGMGTKVHIAAETVAGVYHKHFPKSETVAAEFAQQVA